MTTPMTVRRNEELSAAGSGGMAFTACLLFAGIIDIAVLAAWATGALPGALGVIAHVALVCGFSLSRAAGRERAAATIAAVSMFVMGPVGVIGGLVLASRMRRPQPSNEDLLALHRRQPPASAHDEASEIFEALREGRALAPEETPMRRFTEVMTAGNLNEKQALLGTMSTRFHPDQMPVLRAALRSEEAPVRVSAAAVFARLREIHHRPLAAQAEVPTTGEGAVARARKLAAAAGSGLLGAAEAGHAREAAIRILKAERPAADRFDAVEKLLCNLLQDEGRDDEIENRLGPHADILPPALKAILLRARMRGRRYDRIASLAPVSGEIAALDHYRRPGLHRPLLATGGKRPAGGRTRAHPEPDRKQARLPATAFAQPGTDGGGR